MKTNCSLAIVLVSIILNGCQTMDIPQAAEQERLRLGVEHPPLLPPERAHKVSLRLRSVPSSVSTNDVRTISSLVGRVPGLPRYEVGLLTESTLIPGLFDVSVPPVVVRMKKTPEWQVIRVDAPSY
jgi:hypothetical protein